MKDRFFISFLVFIIIFSFSSQFILAENLKIHPAQPVVITCPGQNPDGLMIKVVLEKQNIDFKYRPFLQPEDMKGYSTLIIAVGHSCKGVGAAGIDYEHEFIRTKKIIEKAVKDGTFIVLTHLGGTGRREDRSDKLLNIVAPYADYMIISKDSNFDRYFSVAAEKYNIPLSITENLSQIKPILSNLFKTQSQAVEYYINGEQTEKTIIINAGTHGDETASQLAAVKMMEPLVDGGRIIIIPRANPEAISAGMRNYPENELLNRSFPGELNGSYAENRAAELFNLIESFSPDLLIDLHESQEFNFIDKKYLGQSLIACADEDSIWQGAAAVETVNSDIKNKKEKFVLISPPVKGSLAWAAGEHLNIPAFTLETCVKLSEAKRVDYQLKVITALLEISGVELRWP
ncbi:MAG: DUF6305 family protein [Bacillota bacterium]